MFRKMFSFAGVLLLAAAVVSATPRASEARGGGGGHGGGGHGGGHSGGFGGFHGGGHYGGYHGGYTGGYYHGGYGRGFGYGHYDGYRHYYGGYYPYYGFHNYPYGTDYSLDNGDTDDAPLLPENPTDDLGNATAPAPIDTLAHLTIRVPVDAQIWIEGTKTASTGAVREFESPPLTPGSPYAYDIKASWNENGHEVTQTQKVAVTAGAHINVGFPTAQTAAK